MIEILGRQHKNTVKSKMYKDLMIQHCWMLIAKTHILKNLLKYQVVQEKCNIISDAFKK